MPVTTRAQKKAAAAAEAAKPKADLTLDEYVSNLKSGLSWFCWYGAVPLSVVLKNLLGHKCMDSLNVHLRLLSTSREWRRTTPLIMAVQQNGDASELIREMIQVHGCDPNMANAEGKSPMFFAIIRKNKEHAKALLECGAVIRDERHYSPVGGPTFMGGWENVPITRLYADFIAEITA